MESHSTLNFVKEVLGTSYKPPKVNWVIPDCKLYSVYDNDIPVGQIFTESGFDNVVVKRMQLLPATEIFFRYWHYTETL
jgi:hypothetical protein